MQGQLGAQSPLLAQAQSQAAALQHRLDDSPQKLLEEKKTHEATERLLAAALATKPKFSATKRASSKPAA
jgi:hypothetical protein